MAAAQSPKTLQWEEWKAKVAKVKPGNTKAIDRLVSLGTGGFSSGIFHVSRRHRKRPTEEYAIKLAIDTEEKPDSVLVLKEEVELTQTLNHENIRKVLSRVHGNGHAGVATAAFEYIHGTDLYYLSEQSLFPMTMPGTTLNGIVAYPGAIFVLTRVLRALQYLHGLSLVLNDLKPDNVLVGADSFLSVYEDTPVKLIDVSLAFREGDLTKSKKVNGTADWMSPEHFAVSAEPRNRSSDIYSFGLVMYAAFTGLPVMTYDQFKPNQRAGAYFRQYELLCKRRAEILADEENMMSFRPIRETVVACLCHKPALRPTVDMLLNDDLFAKPPALRTRSYPTFPSQELAPMPRRMARTRDSA